MTYHVRLNEHGAVKLPPSLIQELGIGEGDLLAITHDATGGLSVKTHAQVIADGQQAFRAMLKTPFTVDEFIAERRSEAEQE